MPEDERQSDDRHQLGVLGERLACRHLAARGYSLVDRNFRTRHGELDVVARDERFLVFCEVKTRVIRGPPGPFGPLAAVGGRKRRQVREMARQWLAERSGRLTGRPPELRFDAIGVTLEPSGRLVRLEHVEAAFQ
jgi:putative endonuclease